MVKGVSGTSWLLGVLIKYSRLCRGLCILDGKSDDFLRVFGDTFSGERVVLVLRIVLHKLKLVVNI